LVISTSYKGPWVVGLMPKHLLSGEMGGLLVGELRLKTLFGFLGQTAR